ncbi:hypothetical protein GCT13_19190 [Paraburkholderia sp. CNPSo 3157]|uniref:TfoX N-terminal domain-containing protein n=1 Tax=Paraburkholderia franconis TaxID=2654983 RepID=A0A7X1NBN3_9BURK|nr:hypothetical protein [Paraburkholderia franconis]MPW18965.1 hypothetical protein [Paraburkholderia franconis]
MKTSRREDVRLLLALRAEAGKYDAISELKMSRCTAFVVHGQIMACAGDNLIALKLPELSVAALLHTSGCRRFQPYGRASLRHWVAFSETSPAFDSLEQLFKEAVAFALESHGDKC